MFVTFLLPVGHDTPICVGHGIFMPLSSAINQHTSPKILNLYQLSFIWERPLSATTTHGRDTGQFFLVAKCAGSPINAGVRRLWAEGHGGNSRMRSAKPLMYFLQVFLTAAASASVECFDGNIHHRVLKYDNNHTCPVTTAIMEDVIEANQLFQRRPTMSQASDSLKGISRAHGFGNNSSPVAKSGGSYTRRRRTDTRTLSAWNLRGSSRQHVTKIIARASGGVPDTYKIERLLRLPLQSGLAVVSPAKPATSVLQVVYFSTLCQIFSLLPVCSERFVRICTSVFSFFPCLCAIAPVQWTIWRTSPRL
ncbi:uncharacterized protein LOC142804235 [Rhipicephalus microplus]|uniref:uncharacterized protein LOC142804235 n=1 Tax=Rhipicephalus microplus TaxID=6941 RepID=UPI003F6A5F95